MVIMMVSGVGNSQLQALQDQLAKAGFQSRVSDINRHRKMVVAEGVVSLGLKETELRALGVARVLDRI